MDREEDEKSSIYEHSEDDDSMYGCDSDGENGKNIYIPRNIQNSNKAKVEDGNPLLINSSVAFGSEDWDDFEQETGGTLVSLNLEKFQEQEAHDLETQKDILKSTSAVPNIGETEMGNDVMEKPVGFSKTEEGLAENFNGSSAVPVDFQSSAPEQLKEMRDIPFTGCQIPSTHDLAKDDKSNTAMSFGFLSSCELEQEDVCETPITYNLVQGANKTTEHFVSGPVSDIFEMEQDQLVDKSPIGLGLNLIDRGMERDLPCVQYEEIFDIDDGKFAQNQETERVEMCPLADISSQLCSHPTKYSGSAESFEGHKPNSTQPVVEIKMSKTAENSPHSVDLWEDHPVMVKAENHELNDFYDEIVNEMEEILLDSGECPGPRFSKGNLMGQSQLSLPLRDGGSTASTSGTDDVYPFIKQPLRIDGVEVVGAKQKRGDVSLGERLVGVREYTVYIIRVRSGKDQWEVDRRYRDFFTLYRRLRSLFADQGWTLPSPWSSVEKESRKIFGIASPDVVSERSVLIQECVCSLLHSGFFSTPPSALVWFLCPQDPFPSSPASKTMMPRSTIFSNEEAGAENISPLGKTISLFVEIRPYKSVKQMLDTQHYTCAGCHKHFNDGMTLMGDFVRTLGWGKPRLCEYTGQLFCSSCHTNENAVLPARVLHHWDFTEYPVSQLAKSYLDSIHKQPMLCVSAVNPFLFSKVPALHHVMNIRKRIGTVLPYVHCPFRRTINKGLGSRKYLLESSDFFALRDLIDLSKGPFAALPVMVETVSRKIVEHITEQCLICCDVGVPCSARQACTDPSSLIFPFQEDEIERCTSCESVLHKSCFRKLTNCTCGARLGMDEAMGDTNVLSRKASGYLLGKRSSSGLLSGLFSRAKTESVRDHKDPNNTVILMGSLPSTSLFDHL